MIIQTQNAQAASKPWDTDSPQSFRISFQQAVENFTDQILLSIWIDAQN